MLWLSDSITYCERPSSLDMYNMYMWTYSSFIFKKYIICYDIEGHSMITQLSVSINQHQLQYYYSGHEYWSFELDIWWIQAITKLEKLAIVEAQIASVHSSRRRTISLSWRTTLQTIVDCQIQTTKTDQRHSILFTSGESSVYWVSFVLKYSTLKRWEN